MSEYWFITYNAVGHVRGLRPCNAVISETPAEWVVSTYIDEEICDGPYVILYAEKITKAQYDTWINYF